jgi:hypothetical protein
MAKLRTASVFALTALTALMPAACGSEDAGEEPQASSRTTRQAVTGDPAAQPSAAALFVDGAPLASGGAQLVLRLSGPGPASAVLAGSGVLPSLADGSYLLSDYSLQAVYGSFQVANGVVTGTTGALVTTTNGLAFDLAQLTPVNVASAMLSVPANLEQLRLGFEGALGSVSSGFQNSPTFYLPDGTYVVHDYLGEHILGTFNVTGHAVTAGTGAVLPAPSGVTFDLAQLASVDVPAGTLSAPANLVSVRLGPLATFAGDSRFYLASGTYSLSDYDYSHVYGGFTVTGTTVNTPTGALVATASGVGFDFTRLAAVTIPIGAFSTPASLEIGRVGSTSTYIGGGGGSDAVFHLPAGSYTVFDAFYQHTYGEFSITGTTVTSATGAFFVDASHQLAGNACALVGVDIAVATGQQTFLSGASGWFSGTSRLALPPGTYAFENQPQSTFTLTAAGAITNVALPASVTSITPHPCEPQPPACDATQAPSLSLTLSPTVLWPPNHKLVPITLTTHAVDSCDPAPTVQCSAISNGMLRSKRSGHHSPDVVWTNGLLYLRAERNGDDLGRTYTVTCTARDSAGRVTTTSAAVTVPSDR